MSAPAIISSGTAAGGPPVGGSGTTNTIPRWTGPSTLGDSGLIDDGSVIYTTARNAAFGSTSSAGYRARVLAAAGAGSAFGLRIDAGTNSTDYALRIANQATTSDYLAVRGDGNVGIGTASPATKLEVVAGTAIPARFATNNGTACVVRLLQSGQREWGIQIPASGTSLSFYDYSAAQERMVIDVNGNVGIGTASPTSIAGYTSLCVNNATTGGIIDLQQSGTTRGRWYNTGSTAVFLEALSSANLVFQTNSTPRMRVNGASAVEADSQVAIGTTSFTSGCSLTVAKSIDCSQSAQGLKLPATPGATGAGTEQILDCYNEGTWTPTFTFGTGGTVSTSITSATFTRVGRLVHFNLVVSYTVTVAPTGGDLTFTLPVATSGAAAFGGGYASNLSATSLVGQVFFLAGSATSTVSVYKQAAVGVQSIPALCTANGTFYFSGTYQS